MSAFQSLKYKILQIIPAHPNTFAYFSVEDEYGNSVPSKEANGDIMYGENGFAIDSFCRVAVLCYALLELENGERLVEAVICSGEYLEVAEDYFHLCVE